MGNRDSYREKVKTGAKFFILVDGRGNSNRVIVTVWSVEKNKEVVLKVSRHYEFLL